MHRRMSLYLTVLILRRLRPYHHLRLLLNLTRIHTLIDAMNGISDTPLSLNLRLSQS